MDIEHDSFKPYELTKIAHCAKDVDPQLSQLF